MSAASAIVPDGAGTRIAVQVVPRASKTEVAGMYGDEALRVRLNAPPVDGKANRELVRFVAETLGVPERAVALVSGQTGRRKTLRVDSVPPDRVRAMLCE